MTQTGLRHQIVSSLRWTALAKLGGQLASWAITLLVIRLLAPGDYGLMAMANVVIGLLAMIAEMGFGASLIQTIELDRARIRQLFGATLLINAAFCTTLFIAAPLLGRFFDEPRLVPVVRVLAFQFVIIAVVLVPDAMLRRSLRYKSLSLIEIASGVSGNMLTLVLAWLGHGVWSLVAGAMATASLRAALLQLVTPDRIAPSFQLRGARRLVSFGASITITRVLWYLFNQADVVIAGKVLGKEALGLYSVAVHLASLPMQRVASIVNDVTFTAFARIQADRRAVSANLRLGVRLAALFAFPVLWGVASVAPDVVLLVMGRQWQAAIVPLQIVAIAVPLRIVGTLVSTTTMSVGRVDISMWTTLIGTLLAPPLFYLGAAHGIIGLSIVWAVITPVMLIINLYRALPNLGLTSATLFAEMSRPVLAGAVMVAGVLGIGWLASAMPNGMRLVVEVVTGVALYFAATALFNRAAALEAMELMAPGWLTRRRVAKHPK